MFSSRIFTVSGLTFRSFIHSELIFARAVRQWARSVLLQAAVQFSQWQGEVGGGMGEQVMGSKECTCCDEHWVLCGSVESLKYTLEMSITLNVN